MQDAKTAPAETKEKNSSHLRCGAVEPLTPRRRLIVPGKPERIVYGSIGGRWPSIRGAAREALVDASIDGEVINAGHWDPNTCRVVGADDLGRVEVDQ